MENSNHSSLVVKSNALINAMFEMSLQGNRFLAYAISLLDRSVPPEIGKPIELEISVIEFADAFKISHNNAYKEIEVMADQFQRKIITLQSDQTLDGSRVKVGLISKQKYKDGEGRVWLKFDEDIVPHLLGLREQYTQYRIKDVYRFSRATSWRTYELLKQYKKIGKREVDIEEFKKIVCERGIYSRPTDLKRFVIDPALKEINDFSDIIVDYSQKKRGRRIVGFIFIIRENDGTKTKQEKIRSRFDSLEKGPCLAPNLQKTLNEEYNVSPKQAKQLANLGSKDEQRVLALLPKLRERWENLKEKRVSLGGYIFKSLQADLLEKNSFIE